MKKWTLIDMKYIKKPIVIEAITFEDLMDVRMLDHSPLFEYNGHRIIHENDNLFLIPTPEGNMSMSRDDMLITGVAGEIYPCKKGIFEKTYEFVSR